MAAWRNKISLLMLKKYFTHSLRSLVEIIFFNTRRQISYLRAAMQYPLYKTDICLHVSIHEALAANFFSNSYKFQFIFF